MVDFVAKYDLGQEVLTPAGGQSGFVEAVTFAYDPSRDPEDITYVEGTPPRITYLIRFCGDVVDTFKEDQLAPIPY